MSPRNAGHSLGSAKVSRAQTFPSYPSEQGEEHQPSLSLASSYAFSYGSGLVQWQAGVASRERQSSLQPAAGEPPAPSAPTICRENWCLPAPARSPPMWKPGEAASLKQRLSLYLFILLFLLSIHQEGGGRGAGEGRVGRGMRSCCEKVMETNETVLMWRFLHDQTRPILGLHADVAFDIRAFPPASTSRLAHLHPNIFRSPSQPTDSCWSRWNVADSRCSISTVGSPSDPSQFAHYPRGWSGVFQARCQLK